MQAMLKFSSWPEPSDCLLLCWPRAGYWRSAAPLQLVRCRQMSCMSAMSGPSIDRKFCHRVRVAGCWFTHDPGQNDSLAVKSEIEGKTSRLWEMDNSRVTVDDIGEEIAAWEGKGARIRCRRCSQGAASASGWPIIGERRVFDRGKYVRVRSIHGQRAHKRRLGYRISVPTRGVIR